jgi:pimeloyl-ACP methyl ester carboxylesterase
MALRERRFVTIVALNSEEARMRWGLGALAALATLSGAQAADPQGSDSAARYAGSYFAAPSIVVRLEARGGALVAHAVGQPDATYAPEGGGKFFSSATNTRLVFQTDAGGQVTGALVTQGSAPSIPARRITDAEADRLTHPPVDQSLAAYASMKDSPRLPDGRVIHVVCMGKGSPVVILTAGAGNWSSTWNKVQPAVARKTRVCAWDRAGFGLSQMNPKPLTVDNSTTDLEAALKAGRIDGPYVAVGHSLGGLESLLLKDRQPRNVVGMVLVDSTVPAKPGAQLPDVRNLPEPPAVAFFRKCAAALRAGTVGAGRPDPDGCLRGETFPPEYPPELRAALDKHPADLPPETVAKAMDFLADWSSQQWLLQDLTIAAKPDRNYGDMPLIVLTAGELPPPPPGQPGPPEAQRRAILDQFRRDHDQMAALSTRGSNRVVEGSSHYIQQIKPQVVIDSIDEVVDEARADMAKSGKTAGR